MLLEKCQQLSELSQRRINLQTYASNREGFKSRQEQIARAVKAILPLVQSLRAFRQRGIANIDLSQKADSLLKFIANVEEKFQENPEWIINNENFNKDNFDFEVKDLQKALEKKLSEAWRQYLTKKRSTNNEILNLLDRVSAFKPTVQRIRSLDLQIRDSNSIPESSEDFERVDRLIEQLKQCWVRLDADEVPEAVLNFLRVAANEGATLSLLTPGKDSGL